MTTLLKKPLSANLISSPLLFFYPVSIILALVFSSLPSASSASPLVYANGSRAKVAKELNEAAALLKWKTSLDIKSQSSCLLGLEAPLAIGLE